MRSQSLRKLFRAVTRAAAPRRLVLPAAVGWSGVPLATRIEQRITNHFPLESDEAQEMIRNKNRSRLNSREDSQRSRYRALLSQLKAEEAALLGTVRRDSSSRLLSVRLRTQDSTVRSPELIACLPACLFVRMIVLVYA